MAHKGVKSLFWVSLRAIFHKEIIHILHSPAVLVFALLFPILETTLLGYILDLNPRYVNTVVYDLAQTQDSRNLIDQFANTSDFYIVKQVNSDKELSDAITRGNAKVGIKIPYDYSRRLNNSETANVLVVVDGSNATVTGEMVSTANRIALQASIKQLIAQGQPNGTEVPIETRSAVLFNPDTRSANFFLPGLLVWELPAITIVLVALSIVKEKEQGTLDQLRMTPINPLGAVIGKISPYAILALLLELEMLLTSYYIFNMPINGSLGLLILLFIPFIFTDLGLGVIVAGFAEDQKTALQLSVMLRVIPPFYLSGYIFQIENMPEVVQTATKFVPHRYAIEIVRGILLRGAGWQHLWQHGLILTLMAILMLTLAAFIYKYRVIK